MRIFLGRAGSAPVATTFATADPDTEPNSIEARLGMADCYDRMQRFDLSRRNYEAALALAPADLRILGAFASSLDQIGPI